MTSVVINNGYGGTITAGYEIPTGTNGESGYWHSYNYRLAWREVRDGMSPVNGWREERATTRCSRIGKVQAAALTLKGEFMAAIALLREAVTLEGGWRDALKGEPISNPD
jgi:hypothetical protein